MTELFNANLNIISQRWPIIASALQHASFEHLDAALVTGQNQTISVNGIQLSSRHNRMAEARLFIEQLPNDCKQVTVYGIGMGDVPSLLIDNPQLQQILICPLNIALFALLLSYTDQSEWLNDKRVVLVHQLEQYRLATHYIAITPDLLLVENKNARIRDLIVFNKNKDYVNRPHSKDNPEMKKRMINNIEFIKQDPDAELLKKQYNVEEALVIGSGPSLEKHYNYLKKKSQLLPPEKPLIISVDTALMPLLEQEIVPDIVVSIDPNISKFHFPKVIPKELNLVYFPKSQHEILKWWPGSRFAAYSLSEVYDDICKKFPKIRLFANGSVIHPAVDLAVKLECKSIILFGCDFSYPSNKTHAYWQDGDLGPSVNYNKKHWVLNGYGEKVVTDLNFRGYLLALEDYIKNRKYIKFYNSSLEGADIIGACHLECQ